MSEQRPLVRQVLSLVLVLFIALPMAGCGTPLPSAQSPDAGREVSPSAQSEPFKPIVAGSRVGMTLPEGAERFSRAYAFRRAEPLLIVVVNELTAPAGEGDEMLKGVLSGAKTFGEPKESKRGDARQWLRAGKVGENPAQMLVLQQGNALATIVVSYADASKTDAEALIDSIQFDGRAPLDPLAMSALGLEPQGKLRVLDTTSQPIMLRDPNLPTPLPSTEPAAFLSVLLHKHGPNISDKELGRLLGATVVSYNPDWEKAEARSFKMGNDEVTELRLQGEKNGEPLAVYAYVVRDGDTAIVAVGYVAASVASEKMPDVVATLRSLERHPFH